MPPPSLDSPAAAWLKDLLGGRLLPLAAAGAAVVSAVLYLTGLLPEGPAAAILSVLVALLLVLFMIRPTLSATVDPTTRGVAALIAVTAGLLCALAALTSVVPGAPAALGEVSRVGDRIDLPPGALGATSRLRLLVHAPLPPGGTPLVEFRFIGDAEPLVGQVERTVSYARVGRGSRAAVAHDRNETWVHGAHGAGATALVLDRIDGPIAGPLLVAVHGEWISPRVLWLICLGVLVVAAIWDERLPGGHFAALVGMALGYGLLVYGNATPHAAVGTSVGSILLGALAGAVAGGLLAMLARLGHLASGSTRPGPGGQSRSRR
jgi:hypothetical protein